MSPQLTRRDVFKDVFPSGPVLLVDTEDLRVAEETAQRPLEEREIDGRIVAERNVGIDTLPATMKSAHLHATPSL